MRSMFISFAGANDAPGGGAKDLIGISDNLHSAQQLAEQWIVENQFDWAHVFSVKENEITSFCTALWTEEKVAFRWESSDPED